MVKSTNICLLYFVRLIKQMHLLCAQEIRKTNGFILHMWHITAKGTFVGLHLCLIHKNYRPTDEQYLKKIINFNILGHFIFSDSFHE